MLRTALFAALLLSTAIAYAWDGKPNTYRVSIDPQATRARIEAEVWVEGRELVLFGVSPTPQLKNGQAEFLEKIVIKDMAGRSLPLTDKGEGEYEIDGDRRVTLSYDVRLDHGKYNWPGGAEEVSYKTDEGLMATGYTLFLVPGVKMHGHTNVQFDLPEGWIAHTPWRQDQAGSLVAESRRDLVNNAFFLGSARAETIRAGGLELKLVMGKRYWPQRKVFLDLFERQASSYRAMFGKPPLARRFLVIINQHDSGDGGAFSSSFSQFLRGDGDRRSLPVWGRVVAHELLHFWNGHALVPAQGSEEWFKEGVTDYLTVTTMARNGLVDRAYVMQFLENLARGQTVARAGMGLKGTIQEAVKDKHRNWLLVYGGGSVAALAMDVAMLRATANKAGMPELMRSLYGEFGVAGKQYTHADIVRHARLLSGVDVAPLLDPILKTESPPDQRGTFSLLGLQLEQYGMLEAHLLRPENVDPAARGRFRKIFGLLY